MCERNCVICDKIVDECYNIDYLNEKTTVFIWLLIKTQIIGI